MNIQQTITQHDPSSVCNKKMGFPCGCPTCCIQCYKVWARRESWKIREYLNTMQKGFHFYYGSFAMEVSEADYIHGNIEYRLDRFREKLNRYLRRNGITARYIAYLHCTQENVIHWDFIMYSDKHFTERELEFIRSLWKNGCGHHIHIGKLPSLDDAQAWSYYITKASKNINRNRITMLVPNSIRRTTGNIKNFFDPSLVCGKIFDFDASPNKKYVKYMRKKTLRWLNEPPKPLCSNPIKNLWAFNNKDKKLTCSGVSVIKYHHISGVVRLERDVWDGLLEIGDIIHPFSDVDWVVSHILCGHYLEVYVEDFALEKLLI